MAGMDLGSSMAEKLRVHVLQAISEAQQELQEDSIKAAVAKFEHELRQRLASFTVNMAQYMSVQVNGMQVVITLEDRTFRRTL